MPRCGSTVLRPLSGCSYRQRGRSRPPAPNRLRRRGRRPRQPWRADGASPTKPAQRNALLALAEAARNAGNRQLVLDRLTELRSMSGSEYLADEIRALQHLDRYSEVDTLLAKIREAQDKGDNVLPSFLYAQIWQDHNLARSMRPRRAPGRCCASAREIGNFGHEIDARMVLAAVAIYRGDPAKAARPCSRRWHARSSVTNCGCPGCA